MNAVMNIWTTTTNNTNSIRPFLNELFAVAVAAVHSPHH
jgi:hypothetical protein